MSAPILGRRTRRGGEYACADTNPRASRRVGLVRLRGKRSTDGMELVSAPLLAFAASALRRQRSSARSHFSIRIQPSLHHILRAGEAWRMLAPRSNAARQKIDHLGLRTARTSFPPRPGCAFVRTRTGRIRPLTCKSSADLESALTRPYFCVFGTGCKRRTAKSVQQRTRASARLCAERSKRLWGRQSENPKRRNDFPKTSCGDLQCLG